MDNAVSAVAYGALGEFEVLDQSLTPHLGGGFYFVFGIGSDTEINNGCVRDIQNNTCVSPNAFCASDTACAEVL